MLKLSQSTPSAHQTLFKSKNKRRLNTGLLKAGEMQTQITPTFTCPHKCHKLLAPACTLQLKAFQGSKQRRRHGASLPVLSSHQDDLIEAEGSDVQCARRGLLLSSISAAALANSSVPSPAQAASYTDERDQYSISIPEGWTLNEGNNAPGTGPTATRRTLAWFEPGNPTSYVTVVVTNVGADYTSLGSFGTAEQFGSNLVGGMDQSFLKKAPKWATGRGNQPLQEASLIKASQSDKAYNIEYIVKRSDDDQRHLLSTVAIGYNGRYTRLYTVTAQCAESQLKKEKPVLQTILNSFQAPFARN